MKTKFCLLVCLCLIMRLHAFSQVKIGDNPTTINNSSLLELETTNKGFVLPRVSITSVNSITPLSAGALSGTVVYNTNSGTTGGAGTGIYYWDGSTWNFVSNVVPSPAPPTTDYWNILGNSGLNYSNFLGTINNVSMRLRTNNIQRLIIDSLGGVGIGSEKFDADDREKLLVDYGTTTSNTIATFRGKIADYFQINLQNQSNNSSASTDYVATADNGTDSSYYVDMGINSSTYAPSVENWGSKNDAYLYANARNLIIGTQSTSDLIFLVAGGKISNNTALRISGTTGNLIVGHGEAASAAVGNTIRGPVPTSGAGGFLNLQGGNGAVNGAGGALNLLGGAGLGTGNGGNVTISAGTAVTGTAGDVVVNTVNTERMRINAAGNIGIGIANPSYKLSILASANPLYLSGVQATSTFTTDSLLTINAGIVKKTPYSSLSGSNSWALLGNSGTNSNTNFIGTTDGNDFVTRTNNVERMRVTSSGSVGIGLTNPQQAFSVGNGMNIDQNDLNNGLSTANALTFGSISGEAIASKRTTGGNKWGIDFYTANSNRMSITNGGFVGIGTTSPSNVLSVLGSNPLYLGGVQATGSLSSDSVLTINAGVVKKAPYSSFSGAASSGWLLNGNSITSGQFLGTTNAQPLILKANNNQIGSFDGNIGSIALGIGAVNNSSDHNVAIGYNASTNSQYTLALGYNATANGVRSVAIGNGGSATLATGAESVAIGYNATSTADQTVSLGYQAKASGQYGVALGYNSQATGLQSTALGYQAQATAQYSNAIGFQAQATALQSTAIGYQAQTSQRNTILLGNASQGNLFVGIGTSTPTAKLHIVGGTTTNYPLQLVGLPSGNLSSDNLLTINSSGVVGLVTSSTFGGTYWSLNGNAAGTGSFLGTTNTTPLAFKYNSTAAGIIDGNNNTALGVSYTASGNNNTAIGYAANASNSSVAVGASSTASNVSNVAVGNNANAITSTQETAIGASSQATQQYNTAVGFNSQATNGSQSTALGASSLANAYQTTAIGYGSQAISNAQTTAVGVNAQANAQYGTALGYNAQAISNTQTTAIGSASKANAQYAIALGYNAQAISNTQTTAVGSNSLANTQYGTAVGYNAQAISNTQTTAVGSNSLVNTQYGTAVGYNAQAISNIQTTALGSNSLANAQYGTAVGYNAQAINNNQTTAIGTNSLANGQSSTSLGYNAKAQASNATVIGVNASTSQANALILGDATATVNVGIGTSTPNTNTKLDVDGKFKLGDNGTVQKNIISTAASINTNVQPQYNAITIGLLTLLQLNSGTNYTDITISLPTSLTSTQASVVVSPSFDLPTGVSIAFARVISTTQVKIRFYNANTTAQNISGNLYVTVSEF